MPIKSFNLKSFDFHKRFRGFLPVVIDIETAGFNPKTDALLEVAAVFLTMNAEGYLAPHNSVFYHILPFKNANLDPGALAFTGIDPFHPFRFAVEEKEALTELFQLIQLEVRQQNCQRAILVGHNPTFDLSFLKAAALRNKIQHPFHSFTTFDTATLAGLAYGETVLAKAMKAAKLQFDPKEAHSALYDAQKTAELFCEIVNCWNSFQKPLSSQA
jgi:ribonuclease T